MRACARAGQVDEGGREDDLLRFRGIQRPFELELFFPGREHGTGKDDQKKQGGDDGSNCLFHVIPFRKSH